MVLPVAPSELLRLTTPISTEEILKILFGLDAYQVLGLDDLHDYFIAKHEV